MSSLRHHCKMSRETFGVDFEEVHRWLDALAYHDQTYMDTNHRVHRHNLEGVAYVRNRWGDAAALAAEQHIMDDLGFIISRKKMMEKFGPKQVLRLWSEVFG